MNVGRGNEPGKPVELGKTGTGPIQIDTMRLEWHRLEKLRAPQSLCVALQHMGVAKLTLVRRELRAEENQKVWIEIPTWLKGAHPFVDRLEKNEIGQEILRQGRDEARQEAYRLQETVSKANSLGLTEVCVPLVVRGEKLGFITTGGFVFDDAKIGEVALEEKLRKLMFSAEELNQAKEEWRNLPHFSADKRKIVIQMLELLAREVVQYFDESLVALEREEAVQKHTYSQLVTSHTPLRNTLRRLNQIAASDTSVLIVGESGTGRELLAHMIHERSPRKDGPFKTLHCSNVPENLMEAELLGYEKGAFPGAYLTKQGILEQCKGGTLYLKEIGDLSLPMQVKILRLIQDKVFTPLGGSEILKANIRLVASTQRNLKRLVQMGAFREDLYFQLNSIELELPPLRQRREDVILLAEYFLKHFSEKMKKEGLQWKEDALQRLAGYAFPGNVRELKNEVERLTAMKEPHTFIETRDLNPKISETLSPIEEIEKGRTLKTIVDEYERQIIAEALAKYNWNKSRVADLFRITRQGLLKKIAKHKLDKRKRI